ncbi:MAG TPA: right-handed parallel beta-helix repeat-containing protein [Thermoleophilaceae bacterium]|nr:right-handed parallel beta-helix repeat-containing protein [Thermoleophilaceae bacterium]
MAPPRTLLVALALLALALLAPAGASAAQKSLRGSSHAGGKVVYKLYVAKSQIAGATLKGRSRSARLSVKTVRRGVKGSRVTLRLSRKLRRRVGRRPLLVLRLRRVAASLSPRPAAAPAPVRSPLVVSPPQGTSPGKTAASSMFDLIAPEADPVSSRCTRYASPDGSNSATGSRTSPFKTAQRLADSLRTGDVGCLRAGVYDQAILALRHGGTAANRTVLRSAPGERALVKGQIWVADGANFVTVAHLDHDATSRAEVAKPSPVVNGDDSLFYDLDVSAANTVCFYIGDREWGVADRTVLRRNRIHNCGQPGSNKRHGIYLAQSRDTVIEQNWIYDNPDRGIQFYPNSVGTVVRGNVIDGNGEGIIFSGDYGFASAGNVVKGNLITNSRLRHDVESWYPDGNPIGTRNVVRDNCIGGGAFGGVESPQRGFQAQANVLGDPGYAGRGAGDYRVGRGSACAAVLTRAR